MIKKLNQKLMYQDKWLKFYQDEIEFSDGRKGTYAWANRKDGVGLVIVTKSKKILLHKEFRYVIKDYSWEIQGGGIDDGESLEEAALRELKEEVGVSVSQNELIRLGTFYPLHSMNTEKVTVFMAIIDEAQTSTAGSEHSEEIHDVRYFSFDEALEMIDTGVINCLGAASIIQMAIRRFEKEANNAVKTA